MRRMRRRQRDGEMDGEREEGDGKEGNTEREGERHTKQL